MSFGCFLPPPLELEESDAGQTAPPVIVSALPTEYAFPGPMVVFSDATNATLSLGIEDPDLEDTLYIRFFIDYGIPVPDGAPTPAVSDCVAAASGTRLRTAECNVDLFCLGRGESTFFLEAMVADREFLSDSDPRALEQPAYRALPVTGAWSIRAWELQCTTSL